MPYSNACVTVLSNFEAGLNYKDVTDPSIFITFPLISDEKVKLIAWTTTPWTLPSNMALAVNPTFDYVKIKDLKTNDIYIVAECRLKSLYPKEPEYEILEKFKGENLKGVQYVPIFNYFDEMRE